MILFQDTSKMKFAKHIDIWIMFSDHQLIRSNVTISWSISLPFAKVLMKYNMFLLRPLKGLNRVTFTIWISPYKWGDNGYCNMVLNFPKTQLKIFYEIPFNRFTFSWNSRKISYNKIIEYQKFKLQWKSTFKWTCIFTFCEYARMYL